LIYLPIVFLTVLIIFNLYIGINKTVTRNPVPKVLGFAPLIVLSGSMEPAIYPGDVVVIRQQEVEKFKIGDIVAYLEGPTVFTHRIVGMEKDKFILKGDNNNTADDIVNPEQFEGKVLFTIPKVGIIITFLKRPFGMGVLALLILAYIFSKDIIKRAKKLRHHVTSKRGGEGEA
jgi:signal peptidase